MTLDRRREVLNQLKTVVVKVGTNVLSTDDDRLDAQVPMRSVKDAILRQVFGP